MARTKPRILVIGAHPDDCDLRAGGTAAKWVKAGCVVRFVAATNGQSGHHADPLSTVVQRRAAEAAAAAKVIGVESQVLPIPCGQMEPNLFNRWMFIRLIRQFAPDLILTHRPNDYHPDHRYTSQLVQDSSYLVRVPYNAPEVPALRYSPVIAYTSDNFRKPCPFEADVVIDIDDTIRAKMAMFHRHTSQAYEWVPWIEGYLDEVPKTEKARKQWLFDKWAPQSAHVAERFRDKLVARYGPKRGKAVKYAEAFEGCEYGARLDAKAIDRFFGGL
ncbi:MAG: PIG-L deacetylase family protein [Phycisphaerae bacterium]